MEINQNIDIIDRAIMDIISHYDEGITSLDLWYEIGELDSQERRSVTEKEILSRLEFLSKHDYVECITVFEDIERWILKG
jgi:hypothetical protein